MKNTCTQQTQTPTRGIQYYQTIPSFYPTPLTSGNDIMYDSNYDYRNTASTPLLPYVYHEKMNWPIFFSSWVHIDHYQLDHIVHHQ